MNVLTAYARLVRLPNLFTAAADILAGYWLLTGQLNVAWPLAAVLMASCCLYAAGIVMNDLRDVETDRRERPNRPLPSGQISRISALRLAVSLCVVALVAAGFSGMSLFSAPTDALEPPSYNVRPVVIAGVLLIAILFYNLLLKETILGPLNMGLCRALNLALGISITVGNPEQFRPVLLLMFSMGLYVASFTYFGRDEAGVVRKRRLVTGFFGIVPALWCLGSVSAMVSRMADFTIILWLAAFVHFVRIGWRTIRTPVPSMMQYAMKTFIVGIVVLDAVIASAGAGWPAGCVVLALLVPTLLLGRRLYST